MEFAGVLTTFSTVCRFNGFFGCSKIPSHCPRVRQLCFTMAGISFVVALFAVLSVGSCEFPGSSEAALGNRCYQVLSEQYDWIGAIAACSNAIPGSSPLAIETEEENELMKAWLPEALDAISDDLKYVWLYGSDLAAEGVFEWHNASGVGTYPMGFTAWAANQPSGKEHYHCLDLNVEDNPFTWDSYPCSGFLYDGEGNPVQVKDFVVCEYECTAVFSGKKNNL